MPGLSLEDKEIWKEQMGIFRAPGLMLSLYILMTWWVQLLRDC